MVEIRRVTVDELRGMGQALFEEHWAEVGHSPGLQVDIDWERYYAIEKTGGLLVIGAIVRGLVVGYSVTVVGWHHQCRGLLHAVSDAVFVVPPQRRKGVGMLLIRETELAAMQAGVKKEDLQWHAPPGSLLERVLTRRGYVVREVTLARAG